jgi:hypothetical protein
VGVELTIGEGADRRRETWIVAGTGEVVAHLQDPSAAAPAGNARGDGDADEDADGDD